MTQWSELRLHDGGPCPVGEDEVVRWICRDWMASEEPRIAGNLIWTHDLLSNQPFDIIAYQVALPEPRDMQVPWHVLPDGYDWAAVDNDGEANAFNQEPHTHMPRRCWTVGATFSGRRIRIDQLIGYDPGTKPWDQSLIQRPEGV